MTKTKASTAPPSAPVDAAVFVGVPLDDNMPPSQSAASNKMYQLLFGSLLGALAAGIGLYLLGGGGTATTTQTTPYQMFVMALIWSAGTATMAYLVFMATLHICGRRDTSIVDSSEYLYALGVFVGFCVTCTTCDVLVRPSSSSWMISVGVTLGATILWSWLMIACGRRQQQQQDNDDVEDEPTTPLLPVLATV